MKSSNSISISIISSNSSNSSNSSSNNDNNDNSDNNNSIVLCISILLTEIWVNLTIEEACCYYEADDEVDVPRGVLTIEHHPHSY